MTADKSPGNAPPSSPDLPEPGGESRRVPGALAPAAAVGFVFLVLRIFAVSGYDWTTAFAVSTTISLSDGLSLIFGSLMAGHVLVQVLLVIVLPLLVATFLWSQSGHRATVLLATTISAVTLVALTVSFGLWWLPLATAAVFGVFALTRALPVKHWLRRMFAVAMAGVGGVTAAAVLIIATFVQTPWVPHEEIMTSHGPVSGYVLSVDPGYLNILTNEHEFVILNSSEVLSRK